jgi:hypothetical protein
MERTESDARWAQLQAIQAEVKPAVVVPICVSRIDGQRHEPSQRARQFAEALSFDASWSRIDDARNRGLAA